MGAYELLGMQNRQEVKCLKAREKRTRSAPFFWGGEDLDNGGGVKMHSLRGISAHVGKLEGNLSPENAMTSFITALYLVARSVSATMVLDSAKADHDRKEICRHDGTQATSAGSFFFTLFPLLVYNICCIVGASNTEEILAQGRARLRKF